MKKVLVATNLDGAQRALVVERLEGMAEVLFLDRIGEDELRRVASEIHIVIRYGGYKPFPGEVFARMEKLEMVQLLCAGTDSVRRTPGLSSDVVCKGASGANSAAVAEHAFAFVLASAKRLFERDRSMRGGVFDQTEASRSLGESTLAIIGLGDIGGELARQAKAFGMTVLGINRRKASKADVDFIGDLADLKDVVQRSQFIALTLPLTEETRRVISASQLDWMQSDACLVNVGRAELVDEDALFLHLQQHQRFFACLDVWWSYPALNQEVWRFTERPYRLPFHTLKNVLMTPHCAALAGDHRRRMLGSALDGVAAHLRSQSRWNLHKDEGDRDGSTL
jgi:phosphoglycerate dehydrogenase-like enzyme